MVILMINLKSIVIAFFFFLAMFCFAKSQDSTIVKKPKIDDYEAILIAYNTNDKLNGYTYTLKLGVFGFNYNYSETYKRRYENYSIGISIFKDLNILYNMNFCNIYLTCGMFLSADFKDISFFDSIEPDFMLGIGYHYKKLMLGMGYYTYLGTYFQAGIAF